MSYLYVFGTAGLIMVFSQTVSTNTVRQITVSHRALVCLFGLGDKIWAKLFLSTSDYEISFSLIFSETYHGYSTGSFLDLDNKCYNIL